MNKFPISVKQKLVLEFIRDYQEKNKTMPSHDTMARSLGMSIPAVQLKIIALKRRGLISRTNIYEISAPSNSSAPIAQVEENKQSGVGSEMPLL